MLFVLSHALCNGLMAMVLTLSGCVFGTGNTIQGSGVAKTETRDVPAFSKIESTGSADVVVTIGDKQSLQITADDNILPLLDTEVKGDKLTIGSHDSFSPKVGIKITITVGKLEEASVRGSGKIVATGIDTKRFDSHISGSGDISIAGKAELLKATVTGSGTLDTTEFPVADVDVRVTGSGDAKVNATKSLNATVTGSGDVQYSGDPSDVQKQVTGSGRVRKA